MPPLAVPPKFPSRSEPDLRAGVCPDALRQFRPKPLKKIGQPYPYRSGAIHKLRQDICLHCSGDAVTEPLDDRPPGLDVRRTCSHVDEDRFEPLYGDAPSFDRVKSGVEAEESSLAAQSGWYALAGFHRQLDLGRRSVTETQSGALKWVA